MPTLGEVRIKETVRNRADGKQGTWIPLGVEHPLILVLNDISLKECEGVECPLRK